jgi:hypothetical protein
VQINNGEHTTSKATVTKDQALQTALAFLETYAGPTAKQIEWTDYSWKEPDPPSWVDKSKLPEIMSSEPDDYSFFFQEMYQGIPVQDRAYSVTVNKQEK